jgi:hypothetical protein
MLRVAVLANSIVRDLVAAVPMPGGLLLKLSLA